MRPTSHVKLLRYPFERHGGLLAQTPGGVPIVYGTAKFCTTNVEFDIQGREDCKSRGLVETGFAETNVKGSAGFTAHVSEHGLVYMPRTYSGTPK